MKMNQYVSFELTILTLFNNFCPIKSDLSGNTVSPQTSDFELDHFWQF